MIDTTRAEHTIRTRNAGKDLERTRRRKEGIQGEMKEGSKEGHDRHRKEKKE